MFGHVRIIATPVIGGSAAATVGIAAGAGGGRGRTFSLFGRVVDIQVAGGDPQLGLFLVVGAAVPDHLAVAAAELHEAFILGIVLAFFIRVAIAIMVVVPAAENKVEEGIRGLSRCAGAAAHGIVQAFGHRRAFARQHDVVAGGGEGNELVVLPVVTERDGVRVRLENLQFALGVPDADFVVLVVPERRALEPGLLEILLDDGLGDVHGRVAVPPDESEK
jgi:hypothetical protein